MIGKIIEKEKAIELRKQGLSYREILEIVPVAKSSLSLWLESVKLAADQQQRLTEKKRTSALRGSLKRKTDRMVLTKKIKDTARVQVGILSQRELFLIGVALYWAEGSKEKEHNNRASKVIFSNSDAYMIKVFLQWLLGCVKIPKEKIYFNIVLHENNKHRIEEVSNYWIRQTGFSKEDFGKIYFKKHNINTKRKNVSESYFGLLRLQVRESSTLNRKIQGWTEGIYGNL